MSREDLDHGGLIYYSNKLYNYLKTKFTGINTKITDLETKVDSDKTELQSNIDSNSQGINQNATDITTASTNIHNLSTVVDNNYNELRTDFDSADLRPTGDSIYINNVEQLVFKDITAGETITIPNSGDGSDFLVECYVQTEQGTPLIHRSLTINTANKNLIEYDDRYVEITDAGAKPKASISLGLTLQGVVDSYNIYTTDFIPIELVDSIENLNSYTLS